jgi:anti-anti-sigma factor
MELKPKIAIKNEGSISVLELLDEEILDESTINDISDSLFSVLEEQHTEHMIVSFVRVKHLSSMALGMLIRLNKKVEEGGGMLKLCDIKPSLYEIFRITKLDKLLSIYDNCEQALTSFGR